MNEIKLIIKFLNFDKKKFLVITFLLLTSALLEALLIYLIKPIIDFFSSSQPIFDNSYILIVIFIIILKFFFSLISYTLLINTLYINNNKIRCLVKDSFFNININSSKFAHFSESAKSTLIINETNKVTSSLQSLIQCIQGALPVIFILTIFFYTNFIFTAVCVSLAVIYFILFYNLIKKKINSLSEKKFIAEQESNKEIINLFSNFIYFKINKKIHDFFQNALNQNLKNKAAIYTKHAFLEISPSASIEFIIYMFITCAIYIAMVQNLSLYNIQNLSNIGLFLFGFLRVNKYFSYFLTNIINYKLNKKSISTIYHIIFDKKKNYFKKNISFDRIKEIKINNLNLNYNNKNIIKYKNFTFKRGSINLIYGKSGSGKTTLVEYMLAIKRIDKKRGSIKINNVNIDNISESNLWSKFSYLTNKQFIPSKKIYDVAKINNPTLSKDNLNYYLKMCVITQFINLKKFYKFKIKDNQKNLSAGQIFRISLFLELIKNPEVLILDESLSVLDKNLKFKILNHLKILSKKIIIIVISHDKTLIQKIKRRINLDTYN